MAVIRSTKNKRNRQPGNPSLSRNASYSHILEDIDKTLEGLASFPILNPYPITEVDAEGTICFVNPTARRLMPDLEQRGTDHPWLSAWKKIRLSRSKGKVAENSHEVSIEERFYRQMIYYVQQTKRFRIYGLDITDYKTKENELRKLNRILKTLNESSQAMLRATDEIGYVNQVCRLIVENCGHPMVWIGYAENDDDKTVRPVVFAGLETSYMENLHITWADAPLGRGPTGTAIRTQKPVRCRNMLTDPKFIPWREEAIKHGYMSSLSLPLAYQGEALGAITIYASDTNAFSDDEVPLLAKLADELAYGISAIRHQLEKEKIEAQKRLIETERLKAEFIADAMHELRTPLAVIKGTVDLALMEDDKKIGGCKGAFVDIGHEITHLSEVLSDLSLITSQDSGYKKKIAMERVNIPSLIKETVRRCRALSFRKRVAIRIGKIPDSEVIGDAAYLEKMLVNLVKNAVTYGKKNGWIRLTGKKDRHNLEIKIADNGIGIPKEDLPRIFERFYRVDKSRAHSEAHGRAGLGLSIAKRIAEAHSGSLAVESILDKGTVFTVSLPLSN